MPSSAKMTCRPSEGRPPQAIQARHQPDVAGAPSEGSEYKAKFNGLRADKELLALPVFKLADEHPLTKAGLRCLHVLEKAELGLRPGVICLCSLIAQLLQGTCDSRHGGARVKAGSVVSLQSDIPRCLPTVLRTG